MASSSVKSNRLKRAETNKSHSWWWDSHISPRNSKWVQENLQETNHHVKRMLKLIEEDGDSFAKKAELYFKKRPELISLVEEFYRMYRTLAERYDHVTGELRKNIPSDLQSQGSGISDASSEPPSTMPSPDRRPNQTKSGPRGGVSDMTSSKGDDSSTLDSESESDGSSVNNYAGTQSNDEEQELHRKIVELEAELREVKEKYEGFEKPNYENPEVSRKIAMYEEELRAANEKIRLSEHEIAHLTTELQNCKSPSDDSNHVLKAAQKEVSIWKNKVEKEKREVSKLQDRIMRYKNNLSERDQEIRGLKEAIANANKSLSEENERLQAEVTRVTKERTYLEDNLKELDLARQSLEEDVRRVKVGKAEMEVLLNSQIETLKTEVAERDDRLEEVNKMVVVLNSKIGELESEISSKNDEMEKMREHLQELHVQHVELISRAKGAGRLVEELRSRVRELEMELERTQEITVQRAEEKREVIRQLCFSIEHYRDGYLRLRQAVIGHKGRAIMSS